MALSSKLELAILSTLLRTQDRAKCGKCTELHGGGGHRTEKFVMEGGNTAHTFLMSGTNVVGTPHNIERRHILGEGDVMMIQSESSINKAYHS